MTGAATPPSRRRDTAEAVTGILILAAAFTAVHLFVAGPVVRLYFGWPAGAVWSNLVASLICVGLAWWRIRARMIAHHAQQLAQAAAHHKAQLALAQAHHREAIELADTRHVIIMKHLGKQSAHLVRQDNAMRDLKGAGK